MSAVKQLSKNHDEALVQRVREIMAAERLSQAAVSTQVGVHYTRFSQWLNRKYPGDVEGIQNNVRRWLDSRAAEAELTEQLPTAPAFCDTPSSQAVMAALSFAQIAGSIACIYGGAGVGKTTTIRRYQENNPNVWVLAATPSTARPGPVLYRICQTLGVRVSTQVHAMETNIVDRIRDTRGLLVIDEAQHLCHRALDQVRAIHDTTGIGVVLAGNEIVYSQMTGGKRAPGFAQLFSRIGKRVYLDKPRIGDVDTLLDAWGITERKAREYCRLIGRRPGALRGLTQTLRIATMFAAGAGEALELNHIKAAWADLGGE